MTTAPVRPTCSPWHARDRGCDQRSEPEADTRIRRVTDEIETDRRLRQRDAAEQGRIRCLVDRLDKIILACERAHLRNLRETPPGLSVACGAALHEAVTLVGMSAGDDAAQVVRTQMIRHRARITDVMDAVWMTQDVLFDLLIPGRRDLPDDVERTPATTTTDCQDPAA